jgi:hypothetical protein
MDQLPREPISGTVRFNGESLKSGTIQFVPLESKTAVSSGGMITDGNFRVPRADGPIPGKYSVLIFGTGEPAGPGGSSKPATKSTGQPMMGVGLIPLRYNLNTKLTCEVTAGAPNEYTFDLKP